MAITSTTPGPAPVPVRPARKLVSMLLAPGAGMDTDAGTGTAAETDPGGGQARVFADGRAWSRTGLTARTAHLARTLREAGLGPGRSVLALLDHDPAGLCFLAAASALGLRVLMPYNLRQAALSEWTGIATAARPDAVVHLRADPAGTEELRALGLPVMRPLAGPPPAPEAVPAVPLVVHPEPVRDFLVLFSSGTTGVPKAISVSEELVCLRVAAVTERLAFSSGARVLMSGLLNNTTGVIFSFGALLHDATLFFPHGRDVADWPAQVAEHRVTHMMLRPIAMKRFVAAAEERGTDLSSLQVVAYGAAAMPRDVLARGRRLMPCAWVQGYGLSETYGPFCWLDEDAHRAGRGLRQVYNVGRPDATLEVRLLPVDGGHADGVGEIAVRGAARMEGYCDIRTGRVRPPREWMRTGDLGVWGPDGDLLLKGRRAGSLLSADGHRIYPEEVEAVLTAVPGVDDAVLVGVADGDRPAGRPVACVAGPLCARGPGVVRAAVTAALSGVLSPEKWPDLLWASPAPFPRSANDKVRRGAVAAAAATASLVPLVPQETS
ncbi:class I adenylate-forming enzyme family protein [Streptomyces sp. NPDC101133]|uniref:class I adenylate-forming enzyme family protein n=1 Tax=Streptomyces sp. NPDC101133 TaxID=3366111 RepID=UPI003801B18B